MKKALLKNLYTFLAFCSRAYIKRNKIFTIGITGSVGKTTARTVISEVLTKYCNLRIYTSPKNYNSELGLVFSIFKVEDYVPSIKNLLFLCVKICGKALFGKKDYDVIVLEYGIDRPNDMDFLLTVNRPDIAIFTKLDYTHSEFFPGGKKEVGDEKFKLMKAAKQKVYLNFSDEYCRAEFALLTSVQKKGINTEYYWQEEDCEHYKLVQDKKSVVAEFETLGKTIQTNAIGEANMHYISLALRGLKDVEGVGQRHHSTPTEQNVGVNLCVHPEESNIHLKLSGQKARFSILEGIDNSVLVDSTYNAGPESMKKIIEDTYTLQQELYKDYKIGFCLGDMREIGDSSDNLHREVFQKIKDADLILSVGPEMQRNFGDNTQKFLSSRVAGKYLKNFLNQSNEKYIILFKGSQNTIFMEEALKEVLKNKTDEQNLCRQEAYWKKEKEKFFEKLEK